MNRSSSIAVLLAIALVGFGCTAQTPQSATSVENPERNLLKQVSGVWRAPSNELITINYADLKLQVLIDETFVPVTVGEIDQTNETINLNLKDAENKPAIWTVRRVWDSDDKNSFHLLLTSHEGRQMQLSFVRKVTSDDLNRIALLQTKTDRAPSDLPLFTEPNTAEDLSSPALTSAETDASAAAAAAQEAADAAVAAADSATQLASDDDDSVKPVLISATLGTAADEATSSVSEPGADFFSDDTVYLSAKAFSVSPSRMDVRWTYLGESGTQVVFHDDAALPPGSSTSLFEISKPDGFPPGRYQAEILLDGTSVEKLSLRIHPVTAE